MLVIQLTYANGQSEEISVMQAEFVRFCLYKNCRQRFTTINPDKVHCKVTHRVMASQQKHFGTIAQARGATTVGLS